MPVIGNAILETLELLISMNRTLDNNMITGLSVDIERSEKEFYMSPAICTVLVPYIGYNKVEEMVVITSYSIHYTKLYDSSPPSTDLPSNLKAMEL